MVRRQTRDDERRPHRFDPDQRGRDFPNKRKRRGRPQQQQTPERRITDLESWSYLSTRVAIQPPANSRIEVVTDLPEANQLDIGRQLIVRSTASVPDVLYVGMQQADGAVVWVQWTSSYAGGGGVPVGGGSFSATFVKHIALGVAPLGCHATTNYVYFSYNGGSNLRRYDRASGVITTLGFPGVLQPWGIYALDDGKIWTAVATPSPATGGSARYWNGTSSTTSPAVDYGYYSIAYNPVNDSIYVGGETAPGGSGRARQLHKTTLATLATRNLSDTTFGIEVDATGNVYLRGVGVIFKMDSAFTLIDSFSGAGSVYGPISNARGLSFDSSQRLFVADIGADRIQAFGTDEVSLGVFGVGGTGTGQFQNPWDVTVHGTTVWVADKDNNRLSEWTIS